MRGKDGVGASASDPTYPLVKPGALGRGVPPFVACQSHRNAVTPHTSGKWVSKCQVTSKQKSRRGLWAGEGDYS